MTDNVYSKSKLSFHKDKMRSILNEEVTAPVYVRIKPTNRCNHRCFYCSYSPDFKGVLSETINLKDEIPQEKMMEILDDFKEIGVKAITFSGGGEPLVYSHIVEAMQKALDNGIEFSMITNGQLLNGRRAELLARSEWVRISMDSSIPEVFSEIRRVPVGFFHELVENIKNFVKIKDSKCELGINYIVNPKNANQVYESAKFFKGLGVNHIKFTPQYDPKDFLSYHSQFKESVIAQIKRAKEELVDDKFSIYDTYEEDFKFSGISSRKYNKCGIMQIVPVIGADSAVYFCHDTTYTTNGKLGSLKNQSFKDLWFSKEAAEMFKNFNPAEYCKHHCTYDSRNMAAIDMVERMRRGEEIIEPENKKHKNFI